MELMPKAAASSSWASVSTLPNTMSGWASEAFSKMGPNMRQGPHQEAQKSTSTVPLPAMVASKLSRVSSMVGMADGLPLGRSSDWRGLYNIVTVTDYSRRGLPAGGERAEEYRRATVTPDSEGSAMGAMKIDTGISPDHREKIAAGLERVLADSYTLYLKTHKYHWNVTGPMFQTLHVMFETQYTELALAVDEIAERIRALGALSPGSYREFGALTAIPEDDDSPDAVTMIRRLVEAQETVVRTARAAFPAAAEADDQATADLLTQRMQVHEKTAWMLRSLLE